MSTAQQVASGGANPRKSLAKSRRQYVGFVAPEYIDPQLCTLVDEPPTGSGWVHEVKFDGYRIQARVEGRSCILRTRKGLDWTNRFPEIARACEVLPDCIIDGEICAVDKEGMPDFAGLQDALSTKNTARLIFAVFDLLWLGREDYRPWALTVRKKTLKDILDKADGRRLHYSEHHDANGAALLQSACRLKLEGIVSKRADARYVSGRAGQWTKTKCRPRQELVIGGWEMNGTGFRSLMLGAYRGGMFAYVGTAGTGFNGRNLPPLMDQLKKLEIKKSPFQVSSPKNSSSVHFVEPKLVCEVAFETWTRSGKIRQASFKGLREDKAAGEIVVEEASHDA